MFLDELNENEKKAFICICINAAKSNREFAYEERELIKSFCKELSIVYFDLDDNYPVNEVVSIFEKSEYTIKKIVILNVLKLLYCDMQYDYAEDQFLKEFIKRIGLGEADMNDIVDLINRYTLVMGDIQSFVKSKVETV